MTDASATRSYTYDKLGNLTKNGDWLSGTYVYGSSKPHAVTSANGKTYQYDANGNMSYRNGQTLVYDEENRLIQVTSGTTLNVHFGYDYNGQRLWKYNKSSNLYTCFVSPLYEYRESDSAGICYVYAAGKRIAGFRPTLDVYNLAGAPLSLSDRLLASGQHLSDSANRALAWSLAPNRLLASTVSLAGLFVLALVLVTSRWMGVRIEKRERRVYFQPLWCRTLSLLFIPVLLAATTEVHAGFTPETVFVYYHGDHLGSSNITTDRSGEVVQQFEYKAYGFERYSVNNASGHPEYNLTYASPVKR